MTRSDALHGLVHRSPRLRVRLRHATVLGIPVTYAQPKGTPDRLALWLPHLSAPPDQAEEMLMMLARGGTVAVSFDPPGHGRRAECPPDVLLAAVMAEFRQRMWPLLGRTVLEGLRVTDWAIRSFGDLPVVAGGVSMGGDVALALAGIDPRVRQVAGMLSSPDWLRPGMREPEPPETVLNQGCADSYAQWFFDQFDPLSHLDRYERAIRIQLQFGARDQHVPAALAEPFVTRFWQAPAALGRSCQVLIHNDYDHLAGLKADRLYKNAAAFLLS